MSHQHGHGGTHRRPLAIALVITGTVLIAEVIGAFVTGSLALLVDAAHMLTDVGGLTVALIAASLALRPPSVRRTWGFLRAEVLAAMAQAAVLLAVGLFAFIEGVRRLFEPPEIASNELIVFGVLGLAANVASILVLSRSRGANMNMRAAFLEVLNDALGSVAVIISAIVISSTGWTRADAIAGMLISALIVPRTLLLLKESAAVLLESTPRDLDLDRVREHIREQPGVVRVHDLHASTIATGVPVLSAHVVVADRCFLDGTAPRITLELQRCVAEHFDVKVEHSTFQLEPESHERTEHATHA